jgi:hypothetical protein
MVEPDGGRLKLVRGVRRRVWKNGIGKTGRKIAHQRSLPG